MPSTVVLVGGGVRTGKSRFALKRALRLAAPEAPILIATAQALDDEMAHRIRDHRAEREGLGVDVVEEPVELARCLSDTPDRPVLVDCLTLWVSNLLHHGHDPSPAFDGLEAALDARSAPTVFVSNEVGLGIVPMNPLARRFRDEAGRLHRRIASRATEVYFGAMGLMMRWRPGPVESVD